MINVLTNPTAFTISQHIHVTNHHAVYLKLMQCYMPIKSQKKKKVGVKITRHALKQNKTKQNRYLGFTSQSDLIVLR